MIYIYLYLLLTVYKCICNRNYIYSICVARFCVQLCACSTVRACRIEQNQPGDSCCNLTQFRIGKWLLLVLRWRRRLCLFCGKDFWAVLISFRVVAPGQRPHWNDRHGEAKATSSAFGRSRAQRIHRAHIDAWLQSWFPQGNGEMFMSHILFGEGRIALETLPPCKQLAVEVAFFIWRLEIRDCCLPRWHPRSFWTFCLASFFPLTLKWVPLSSSLQFLLPWNIDRWLCCANHCVLLSSMFKTATLLYCWSSILQIRKQELETCQCILLAFMTACIVPWRRKYLMGHLHTWIFNLQCIHDTFGSLGIGQAILYHIQLLNDSLRQYNYTVLDWRVSVRPFLFTRSWQIMQHMFWSFWTAMLEAKPLMHCQEKIGSNKDTQLLYMLLKLQATTGLDMGYSACSFAKVAFAEAQASGYDSNRSGMFAGLFLVLLKSLLSALAAVLTESRYKTRTSSVDFEFIVTC